MILFVEWCLSLTAAGASLSRNIPEGTQKKFFPVIASCDERRDFSAKLFKVSQGERPSEQLLRENIGSLHIHCACREKPAAFEADRPTFSRRTGFTWASSGYYGPSSSSSSAGRSIISLTRTHRCLLWPPFSFCELHITGRLCRSVMVLAVSGGLWCPAMKGFFPVTNHRRRLNYRYYGVRSVSQSDDVEQASVWVCTFFTRLLIT